MFDNSSTVQEYCNVTELHSCLAILAYNYTTEPTVLPKWDSILHKIKLLLKIKTVLCYLVALLTVLAKKLILS